MLKKIKDILKKDGLFYLGMKEGEFEGIKDDSKHFPGQKRFFALYTDSELKEIITKFYTIIHTSKVTINGTES
jgi:hypothetical protein